MRTLLLIFIFSCATTEPYYRVTRIEPQKDSTYIITLRRLGNIKVIRTDCLPDTIVVGKKVKL